MARIQNREPSAVYSTTQAHLDYYFQKLIDSPDSLFTIQELRDMLQDEVGFRFQTRTLKKYLRECQEKFGQAPLQEVYRLNPDYYIVRDEEVPQLRNVNRKLTTCANRILTTLSNVYNSG